MRVLEPISLVFAGIGSRRTPPTVLRDMTIIASWLTRRGWHLASGGADGADTAFARGAPTHQRTIYIPWPGYNGHQGDDMCLLSPRQLRACIDLVAPLHPAWHRCSPGAQRLHARNAAILLAPDLDHRVDAVIAWTEHGAPTGGTGMGLRIAAAHQIPVLNLGLLSPRTACERLLTIRPTT